MISIFIYQVYLCVIFPLCLISFLAPDQSVWTNDIVQVNLTSSKCILASYHPAEQRWRNLQFTRQVPFKYMPWLLTSFHFTRIHANCFLFALVFSPFHFISCQEPQQDSQIYIKQVSFSQFVNYCWKLFQESLHIHTR